MADSEANLISFTPKELFLEIRADVRGLTTQFSTDLRNLQTSLSAEMRTITNEFNARHDKLTAEFNNLHDKLEERIRNLEDSKISLNAIAGNSKSIRTLTWGVGLSLLGVVGNVVAHYLWR